METLKKQIMITIFILYATPTIIKVVYNLSVLKLQAIIMICILDCIIFPIMFYLILQNLIETKFLELFSYKRISEDKISIYMQVYIIALISGSATIGGLIYTLLSSSLSSSGYTLIIQFETILYAILSLISLAILYYLNKKWL